VAAVLIVNPRAGAGRPSCDELVAAAEARGFESYVLREGEDPAAVARTAGADVLAAAGGDGTVSGVAEAAVERNLPFVCVPFGTRNHFARDAGLDVDDPLSALAAVEGVERAVDVGRVNGDLFLNNVSLGLYADLVHRRVRHHGRREALARLRALTRLAGDHQLLHARVDGEPLTARVLLVGNNRYTLNGLSLGRRDRLDAGVLFLWAATGVLPRHWSERSAPRFRIELDRPLVHAAVDGEPVELETPLDFEVLPGSLRLLLPPGLEHGAQVRERQLAR
jgi:diacylglycerol kinase family enzyme